MTRSWRENWPAFAAGGVLAATLVAVAVLAPEPPTEPAAGNEANVPAFPAIANDSVVRELAALPAGASDDDVIVSALPPEDARARNAAVPFITAKLKPAPPFRFQGSERDRLRARECLALAAMAEAGAGDPDQRAVMQVVLNRARHPAFANTVCGVVFEGSERRTGCQFTFTCDGSLARSYSASRWQAARQRADEMLAGYVYAPVGNATHYHTDWVYPWWSGELDKLARVGTHLFFRWRGFWGTPAALNARYDGGEPDPIGLRREAERVDRTDLVLLQDDPDAVTSFLAAGSDLSDAGAAPPPGVHFITVEPGARPSSLIGRGRDLCPGNAYCQVFGWAPGDARPRTLPLSGEARRSLRFSFLAGRRGGADAVFFDCDLFPGAPPGTCLPASRPSPREAARQERAMQTARQPAGADPAPGRTPAPASGLAEPEAGRPPPAPRLRDELERPPSLDPALNRDGASTGSTG
jgi:hypothetical protein